MKKPTPSKFYDSTAGKKPAKVTIDSFKLKALKAIAEAAKEFVEADPGGAAGAAYSRMCAALDELRETV